MSRLRTPFAVLAAVSSLLNPAVGQTLSIPSFNFDNTSDFCVDGSDDFNVCVTLPSASTTNLVDIFFLLDDTASFTTEIAQLQRIINSTISELERALSDVSFGFGVGRFEDYGGEGGARFSGQPNDRRARPFILNQPIVTMDDAGGAAQLDSLIYRALTRTAPGSGGDAPEAAIGEALYQVATGFGFDGDGDGFVTGRNERQRAGRDRTQDNPDRSGDVPDFASILNPRRVPRSGFLGGAGFRPEALKLVILGTDVCSVAAFDRATGIPTAIPGPYSTELVSDLVCSNSLGADRYGFVSTSLSPIFNVNDEVAPRGAATLPAALEALVELGIRVVGMAPNLVAPRSPGSGPSVDAGVSLSALARYTGAVDSSPSNNPILINADLTDDTAVIGNIVNAVQLAVDFKADIAVRETCSITTGSITPNQVANLAPGDTACFDLSLARGPGPAPREVCAIQFEDTNLRIILAEIPIETDCNRSPIAVCQDISIRNPRDCEARVPRGQINDGSFDPDGDSLRLRISPRGPYPLGETEVTLTAIDPFRLRSTCTATITVSCDNVPTTSSPSSAPTPGPCECPPEDLRLVLNRGLATWQRHRETAERFGCTLASITTQLEQDQVEAVVDGGSGFAYIGGFRQSPVASFTGRNADDGGWRWLDGNQFNDVEAEATNGAASSWNSNPIEPDNAGNTTALVQDVIAVNREYGSLGAWYDASGEEQLFQAVYKCCRASRSFLGSLSYAGCQVE